MSMSTHDNDQAMREFATTLPVPDFDEPAFKVAPPLARSRVAIVTSAALNQRNTVTWQADDFHFETLPRDARDLQLGHLSPNFDRSGFAADLNVVYPIDRLQELDEQGVIGSVASNHYAFAGNQPEGLSALRLDSGPACAGKLLADGVDVVLLTPV